MSVLLEMRGIRKSFYGNEVLHSVDLTLEAGTVLALMGENGAGKSTAYELDPRFANNIPIINPDVYAKEFANKVGAKSINDLPHNIQNTINIKAGKLALKARQ